MFGIFLSFTCICIIVTVIIRIFSIIHWGTNQEEIIRTFSNLCERREMEKRGKVVKLLTVNKVCDNMSDAVLQIHEKLKLGSTEEF